MRIPPPKQKRSRDTFLLIYVCDRPEINECAVVALPSEKWGQKVAAIVILSEKGKTAGKGGKQYGPMDLRRALKERIANYKIPQEMKVVDDIPRNAMGKSELHHA
jgi:malonyl-CoA/methylmalonyl-CoA synthetase